MYTIKALGKFLKHILEKEKNPVKIADLIFKEQQFNNMDDDSNNIADVLSAMEMGPEFVYSYEELQEISYRLIKCDYNITKLGNDPNFNLTIDNKHLYTKYSEVWSLLEKEIEKFPESRCQNASIEQIEDTEKKLGFKIDIFFEYFLQYHQCSSIKGLQIFTITNNHNFPSEIWSLVENDNLYKKESEWPDIDDWLIISDDDSGNPIGILPNGEIWTSDHNNGFKKYKLANDFEEFVYKLLTETLWDD